MKRFLWVFLLLLTADLSVIHAQVEAYRTAPPAWMLVNKFTPGEASYAATRKNLEARFGQGRSPLAALQIYLPKARKGDLKSLFSAGVCALENDERSQQEVQLQRRRKMEEVLHLIDNNPRWPTNYECIRLSFLLEGSAGRRFWLRHEVFRVAQLLRNHQSNDVDVEKQYGWLLIFSGDLVPTEQAQTYFRRMISKYPAESLTFKSMLASSYQWKASREGDPKSVDKELALRREIVAAQRKLPLTPRRKESIANSELLIRLAERYKNKKGL